jgi:hypothetical protein
VNGGLEVVYNSDSLVLPWGDYRIHPGTGKPNLIAAGWGPYNLQGGAWRYWTESWDVPVHASGNTSQYVESDGGYDETGIGQYGTGLLSLLAGQQYLYSLWYKSNAGIVVQLTLNGGQVVNVQLPAVSEWTSWSKVVTPTANTTGYCRVEIKMVSGTSGSWMLLDEIKIE